MEQLTDRGFEAYIIGGAIRDILFKETPIDYDVFTNATGDEILGVFPSGVVIGNEERQKKILTVIVDGIEVSQYRKNGDRTEVGTSLKEHIATCDFTINAIAMGLDQKLINLVGGIEDCDDHIIRCVGSPEERFREDPLRILRCVRFSVKYGLGVEDNTFNSMKSMRNELMLLPPERIREEFMKVLDYNGISSLYHWLLLPTLIPECIGWETDGGEKHRESIREHSLFAVKNADTITDNTLLKFACLLHDIGKVETKKIIDDHTTFHKHEFVGALLTKQIMERLKFSTADIKYVTTLVRYHMFGFMLDPSKKAYAKFFKALEDNGVPIEDWVLMTYCDNQANMAKKRLKYGDFIAGNKHLHKYYEMKHKKEPFRIEELEINGFDVMKQGIKEGKDVGVALKHIFDRVLDGELENTRKELLKYLKENGK